MELIKESLIVVLKQKEGIRLSKENSDNLFNAAELLSANNFYSPAIPLLILSAEEMIKSFALCLEFLLGDRSEVKRIIKNSKSKRADSHLFNHVDKHELAKIIIQDLKVLSTPAIIVGIFLPANLKVSAKEFVLSSEQKEQVEFLLSGIEKFNEIKNQGLYVGEINGEWKTPLSFDQGDYSTYREMSKTIRDIFSNKIDLFLKTGDRDLCLLVDAFT